MTDWKKKFTILFHYFYNLISISLYTLWETKTLREGSQIMKTEYPIYNFKYIFLNNKFNFN